MSGDSPLAARGMSGDSPSGSYGRAVKLYGYINGKAVELTDNPAFNVEYEKDQVKVYWLRKDLSTLPATMPVTCPIVTTASQISY